MKVFVLTVLLISICCLEGALVKREAEEEPTPAEVPPQLTAQFTEFIQRLKQQGQEFTSLIKNKFGQEQMEEMKKQANTFLQQMQSRITPLTEQMTQNMARLFSIFTEPKQPAQEGV
ncbi:apolipoprotein A-II [Candoia aspera]|uniref:apolipoprotein A-II n=1 Tax=Candoia aspera TaxID=51853 RepID=UPI002FD7EBDB